MSKYLVKILAVCAFVVLLPLAIVASALSVTESAACTLEVFIYGNTNANASAKVLMDGEEISSKTVVKNSTVNLTFESEGYYFLGWYNGIGDSYDDMSEPLSTNVNFDYSLVDGKARIAAVCLTKTYKINFSGYSNFNNTFKYGDKLPAPAIDAGSEKQFAGWALVGEVGLFNNATFASSELAFNPVEITVTPVFTDEKIVTYYNKDGEAVLSEHYNAEQFEDFKLKTTAELKAYLTRGYSVARFVSNDEQTLVIDEAYISNLINAPFSKAPLNLRIVEEETVYNLDVKFHATSSETRNLGYSLSNGVTGIDNFKRTNYKFVGVRLNGILFEKTETDFVNADGQTIGDALIEGIDASNAVAVWQSMYDNTTIQVTGDAGDDYERLAVVGVKDGKEENIFKLPKTVIFSDEEGGIKLEDNVVKTMLDYDSFEDASGNVLVLKGLTIRRQNSTGSQMIGGDVNALTFSNIMAFIDNMSGTGPVELVFSFGSVEL